GIKKGILEIADALAVNKCDGDGVERAQRAAAEYRSALGLFRHESPNWDPPVLTVSALEGRGIEQVWATIEDHRARLGASGELAARRQAQQQKWLWSTRRGGRGEPCLGRTAVRPLLPGRGAAVRAAKTPPPAAARRLLPLREGGAGGARPPPPRRARG